MSDSSKKLGSPVGLAIMIAIGFAVYFVFENTRGMLGEILTYDGIVAAAAAGDFGSQFMWLLMNWTEPQFYAGVFTGIAIIVGACVAYFLTKADSDYSGFGNCNSLLPWILASQFLSAGLAIWVFGYINLFNVPGADGQNLTWIATFLPIVSTPPAMLLTFGPSIPVLLTGSILSGLLLPPTATWISQHVIIPLDMPFIVSNVMAMAIVTMLVFSAAYVMPWIKKTPIVLFPKKSRPAVDVYSTKFFIRRCLADWTEPPFYGNEVASVFLLVAITLDWWLSPAVPVSGSGLLPAIMLSQFVGVAIAVFFYAHKYENGGWYPTFMPIASVGPACVLVFGPSIPVALFGAVVGATVAPPMAETLNKFLPEGFPPLVGIVSSMAVCATVTIMTMRFIGFPPM